MSMHKLYTIGYPCFSADEFIRALKNNNINALVDVRDSPYSQRFEQFKRENLEKLLKFHQIYYLHFGEEFGGRPKNPELYSGSSVDFAKVAKSPGFLGQCARIKTGLEKYNICLMCAQNDPAICHRAILITDRFRYLYPDAPILHIQPQKMETQEELDKRIMKMHKLDRADLIGTSYEERRKKAYAKQEEKIAYSLTQA